MAIQCREQRELRHELMQGRILTNIAWIKRFAKLVIMVTEITVKCIITKYERSIHFTMRLQSLFTCGAFSPPRHTQNRNSVDLLLFSKIESIYRHFRLFWKSSNERIFLWLPVHDSLKYLFPSFPSFLRSLALSIPFNNF